MKKKLIALLCVTAVVMGMTACGSDSKENKEEAKGEEKKTIRLAAGDPSFCSVCWRLLHKKVLQKKEKIHEK